MFDMFNTVNISETPEEAENTIKNFLDKYQQEHRFITLKILKKWILDGGSIKKVDSSPSLAIRLFISFFDGIAPTSDILDVVGAIEIYSEKLLLVKIEKNREIYTVSSYTEIYNEAIKKMKKEMPFEALHLIRLYFSKNLNEGLIHSELYRVYGNLASIFFSLGNNADAMEMINYSMILNPQYEFVQILKKRIENTPSNNMEFLFNRPNYLELEELLTEWAADEIIEKFSEFGVEISQKEFIATANEKYNSEEVEQKLITPYFTAFGIDEDFSWMGTQALLSHFLPEKKFIDIFHGDLEIRVIYGDNENFLEFIKPYLLQDKDFFTELVKFKDYEVIREYFLEYVQSEYTPEKQEEYKKVCNFFQKQTEDLFFDCFEYIKDWNSEMKEGKIWDKHISFLTKYNLNIPFFCNILERSIENSRMLTVSFITDFLESLDVEKISIRNLTIIVDSIEEYLSEDIYTDIIVFKKFQKRFIKENKKRKQRIEDITDKRISLPEKQYFEFIKKLDIDFSLLTNGKIELSQSKIGRNDKCICGSGKKYKKCCL